MGIEIDGTAPYAPADNVLVVIRRLRERGLPEILSTQELGRLGIPDGNTTRTLRTLRFLGLIDNEGQRTSTFNRLGRASTSEYPELLGEVLREAYQDVFKIVDPANSASTDIVDAFRHYQPQAQRERMVRLFMGLCREAGIIPGGPPEPRLRPKTSPNGKIAGASPGHGPRSGASRQVLAENQAPRAGDNSRGQLTLAWDELPSTLQTLGEGYFLLQGLLRQLPPSRQWTQERRDQWLKALTAMLDFLIEVVEPGKEAQQEMGDQREVTPY